MELAALLKPFPVGEVELKVQAFTKDRKRAQVVAYVDARTVMDRLDAVVGPDKWEDHYEVLADKVVDGNRLVEAKCTLTLFLEAGAGVSKEDVGEGDSLKAAFSDAFKRAAVKFGVGRYLYRLPKVWAEVDERGNILNLEQVKAQMLGGVSPVDKPAQSKPAQAPAQAEKSGGPTDKQLKLLHVLMKKAHMESNDDRELLREYAGIIAGRKIGSVKELSPGEVSKLIDNLKELVDAAEKVQMPDGVSAVMASAMEENRLATEADVLEAFL